MQTMGGGGEGRDGDWECGACGNRNYAFRSFCNRCKKLRLLVDTKTPADSKWLPRIGDWICTGCTNNNYASRDKCKKCGQPKEVAALTAFAHPGASVPTHPHYFARTQGGPEQKLDMGSFGNGAPQNSLPLTSNWYPGVGGNIRMQQTSNWHLGGNLNIGPPFLDHGNQLLMAAQKGWRNGDWICNCGFHNYSSRAECKKCNASMPPALGTKRLASEDLVHDWDNKRLNAGQTHGLHSSYPAFDQMPISMSSQPPIGAYQPPSYTNGASAVAPNLPVEMPFPHVATNPTLLGKGAKQWRDGDWMCTNCNNHNYASRSNCNRCKTVRDSIAEPVSAA